VFVICSWWQATTSSVYFPIATIKRTLDPQKSKRKKLLNLGGLFFLLEPILVREIMTKDPVWIAPDKTAKDAATVMLEKKFGALPVVKGGKRGGIVTETDLLRCFAAQGKTSKSRS
jgi:CBS domain-containing protein